MNRRMFTKILVAGVGSAAISQKSMAAKSNDKMNASHVIENRELLNTVKEKISSGSAVRIDCYGDSVIWGSTPFEIVKQSAQNAPKSLEKYLSDIFPSSKISVNNFGIQGSTLSGFVSGADYSQGTIEVKARNKVDVIYLNHGINDALHNIALNEYRDNLHRVVDACSKNKVALIFVTPNALGINGFGSISVSSRINLYVDEMKYVAKLRGIEIVDHHCMTQRDVQEHLPKEVIPDGAHLSEENYSQLGCNMALPLTNYAHIKDKDIFRFIGADIGCQNNISVLEDGRGLLIEGEGLKTIAIPLLLGNVHSIAVECDGGNIYANINGLYRGQKKPQSSEDIIIETHSKQDRSGLKVLTISSNEKFVLKALRVVGS